jgi:hypothetical protein
MSGAAAPAPSLAAAPAPAPAAAPALAPAAAAPTPTPASAAPTLAPAAEVVSLPPLVEASPLVSAPCPSAVDSLIREWIARAQRGEPHGGAEEKSLERVKHLFGVLELSPPGGGGGACASLQVFVQLSQFQKERHIFLHFYQSTDRDRERGTTARLATMKDRKEAGFVYCDALTLP